MITHYSVELISTTFNNLCNYFLVLNNDATWSHHVWSWMAWNIICLLCNIVTWMQFELYSRDNIKTGFLRSRGNTKTWLSNEFYVFLYMQAVNICKRGRSSGKDAVPCRVRIHLAEISLGLSSANTVLFLWQTRLITDRLHRPLHLTLLRFMHYSLDL